MQGTRVEALPEIEVQCLSVRLLTVVKHALTFAICQTHILTRTNLYELFRTNSEYRIAFHKRKVHSIQAKATCNNMYLRP